MGSTAITGELVWPSQNDVYGSGVSGSVGDGKKHLEVQRRKNMGSVAGRNNYMISGGTLPATDVNLVIDIAAGEAILEGHYCKWPTTSITLPNNNTSYIFIKLVFSSTLITGLEIEDNTSGTPPTASLQLGTAVTSGGATTSTTDTRIVGPGAGQVLTSGTTFTWPAGVYRIKARLFGPGGGGGGGCHMTVDGGTGGNGGSTTFGALTANGGGLGQGGLSPGSGSFPTYGGQDGVAGTASGGSINISGLGMPGGRGGASYSALPPGGAGGPGGYSEGWVTGTPGGTTSYAIGAGGAAGVGATSPAYDGTVGPAGKIILEY